MLIKELIAYGFGNIICSLFQGFPSCVALSRCAILETIGGKTQVCKIISNYLKLKLNNFYILYIVKMFSLIASLLLLVVCFFISPLFRTLPNVNIIFWVFNFSNFIYFIEMEGMLSCDDSSCFEKYGSSNTPSSRYI